MFHVVLFQPEIPPNTGNVIRLCANTGACLHLIEPLGFGMDDAKLRRAGLDYHEWASVRVWKTMEAFAEGAGCRRLFAFSTRARQRYDTVRFGAGDGFLFGPETRGLPQEMLDALPEGQKLRIPMRPGGRSLNLSNSVAVVVYEAWRQQEFGGDAAAMPP
jgi:tRNA (cytidine/uridine-2'-O-)-methyltransferase